MCDFIGIIKIKKGCDFMGIGQRIKERRKALKMSAEELGKRLGKDRSTIYRYEKGDIENLPLDILEPIAKALNTTPQFLMGWEQVQKNNSTIADAVVRMRVDDEFLSVVGCLLLLDSEKISSVKRLLSAFNK